jgi:hypothetical protein
VTKGMTSSQMHGSMQRHLRRALRSAPGSEARRQARSQEQQIRRRLKTAAARRVRLHRDMVIQKSFPGVRVDDTLIQDPQACADLLATEFSTRKGVEPSRLHALEPSSNIDVIYDISPEELACVCPPTQQGLRN